MMSVLPPSLPAQAAALGHSGPEKRTLPDPRFPLWHREVLGMWKSGEEDHLMVRHEFVGAEANQESPRLAIFAGIHGDEPATIHALHDFQQALSKEPEMARGLVIHAYPICNPTGFLDGTRHSRSGLDLNREFWRGSLEPEVAFLEEVLMHQNYAGIISLHADDGSHGVYGYSRGAFFTDDLLRPALKAASAAIPVNHLPIIDGFHAVEGIIHSAFDGILTVPPGHTPQPFEIILESPATAPLFMQQAALVLGLKEICHSYLAFISHAADI